MANIIATDFAQAVERRRALVEVLNTELLDQVPGEGEEPEHRRHDDDTALDGAHRRRHRPRPRPSTAPGSKTTRS